MILEGFLRSPIFDEFSIGKRSAKNLQFGVRGSAKGESPGNFGGGRRVGRGPSEALESAEIGKSI